MSRGGFPSVVSQQAALMVVQVGSQVDEIPRPSGHSLSRLDRSPARPLSPSVAFSALLALLPLPPSSSSSRLPRRSLLPSNLESREATEGQAVSYRKDLGHQVPQHRVRSPNPSTLPPSKSDGLLAAVACILDASPVPLATSVHHDLHPAFVRFCSVEQGPHPSKRRQLVHISPRLQAHPPQTQTSLPPRD